MRKKYLFEFDDHVELRATLVLKRMRGADCEQSGMFSYISAERRVPKDHPLRAIRAMADVALNQLSEGFDAMNAWSGRPSIAPERLFPRCC
jgi:hypothetical protein